MIAGLQSTILFKNGINNRKKTKKLLSAYLKDILQSKPVPNQRKKNYCQYDKTRKSNSRVIIMILKWK